MKQSLAHFAVLAMAPTLALSACRENAAGPHHALDPDVYVAVMGELADLRRFPPSGIDGEDIQLRTDSVSVAILNAHGVTALELLAFARESGSNPARMETLADQIAAITDSLAGIRGSLNPDNGSNLPDTLAQPPVNTPTNSGLRRTVRDSMGMRHRNELDSIRRARKLPSR